MNEVNLLILAFLLLLTAVGVSSEILHLGGF